MSEFTPKRLLTFEVEDEVALIGINRPEKRNAIHDDLADSFLDAIQQAEKCAKAAVIFGHGNHFSAGLDLAEHATKTAIESVHGSRHWHHVFDRMQRGRIPWVSALHGAVIGGGLEIAASTHIRVADETAFFALPEGQRGIYVGGGGSVRVARLMGVAHMTDMMLTGRVIEASDAEKWNVVQYVVPKGGALDKAKELARIAGGNATLSNYAVIHALPRIQDMAQDDGLFVEAFVSAMTQSSPEAHERISAFLEKRAGRLAAPAPNGGSA